MSPKVSVIIPAYNAAATLPRMLDAIKAQTFENFEVVVINDGSKDDTQSVLEQYRHAAEELSKEVEAGHVEQSVVDMAVNYAKALREEQDRWAYIIALLHKPRFNKKFLKKNMSILMLKSLRPHF